MTAVGRSLGALGEARSHALRRRWRRTMDFGVRPWLLRGRVTHVHGLKAVKYGPQELLLLSVVRNGALYVESFIEHYTNLGVVHCVFLDNGSTDGTVEMLCRYPAVTVLRTSVPYAKYENTMKRYLAERFARGRWHLFVDIDELFDYPFSSELPLSGFLRYLNTRAFTAVVAQMLDMFSAVPLGEPQGGPRDRLKDKYTFYDISAVERRPYEWSEPRPPHIRMHWGGIRRTVFGTDNGLTKAPLVRMDGKVKPFVEWHQTAGATLADVSCVLLHYPFAGDFRDKVRDAVRTGRYGATTTNEYVAYDRRLSQTPSPVLMQPTARRFTGLEPLIADGFLVVSDEYRRWVRAQGTRR